MNNLEQRAATHLSEQHLTEEQFSDFVLGLSTEAMDLHVEQCEACRAEALRVQDAVGMFAEAGREWSTLHPAMPAAEAARSIRRRSLWLSLRPAAGFAAAAAVVFGVTISAHRAPSEPAHIALNNTHEVVTPMVAAENKAATPHVSSPAQIPASAGIATVEASAPLSDVVTAPPVLTAPAAARERHASSDEVAQDNALMAAIDAEMSTPYTVADVSRPFHGQ